MSNMVLLGRNKKLWEPKKCCTPFHDRGKPMQIGCIILAAGKSTRFGGNKLLAPLEGIPLLAHTLQAIPSSLFSQVLAVVSNQEVAHLCWSYGVEVCYYEGGPQSQSIRMGLQALSSVDGCLFVMGDQPLCRADSIGQLVASFQAQPQAIHRLAYKGQPSSPTLFPRHLFPALMQLTGEQGGMAAVGDTPVCYVEAGGSYELWDADTPERLSKIQQFLQAHP